MEEIKTAVELSEEAAYSPAELVSYEKYWDAVSVEKTRLSDAKAEGMAMGEAKGKAEGIAIGAARGKAKGRVEVIIPYKDDFMCKLHV